MKVSKLSSFGLALLCGTALGGSPAFAQDAAAPQAAEPSSSATAVTEKPAAQEAAQPPSTAAPASSGLGPEIVITGTAGGRGVNRIDAPFAITTLSAQDLVKAAPKSSAELLSLVPGVWVESSGGVAGANITVRGLPSAGDAPFVTYQLQGIPVYPAATVSFLENSSMFRVDETIGSVEAVTGGPTSTFSNGQPGLTTNFRLKEGGDVTSGLIKGTVTDYGTKRADVLLSGMLANDLYYMVGGYATSSKGIRSTQFDSEVGKQLTVNLTKRFDGGKLNLYARYTDDHGAWYLPIPINVPGVNLGTFTELGNYSRYATLPTGPNQTRTFDLARGRGFKGTIAGANFEKAFGDGWQVHARVAYTDGHANTLGLVNDGAAIPVSALAAQTGTSVTTADGRTLAGTSYVENWGQWVVLKHIKALTGEASVTKTIASNDITVGYYGTNYSSDDWWSLGNFRPMEVHKNGNYLSSTFSCQDLAAAGSGSGCWNYDIQDSGTTHTNAVYIADTAEIFDGLKIDGALRYQHNSTNFINYSNAPGTFYPDMSAPSQVTKDTRHGVSWTAGIDYRMQKSLALWARVSRGFFFPNFDDYRNAGQNGTPLTAKLTAYEGGLKLRGQGTSLDVTLFHNEYRGSSNGAVFGGVPLSNDDINANGVQLEGRIAIYQGLSIRGNATFQKSKIVASTAPGVVGNEFQRQPQVQVRVSPTYEFNLDGAKVDLFGSYGLVGRRFSDDTNTVRLPAYAKVDLGGTVEISGIEVGAFVDNLTNSHGLTEGDPRTISSGNARPIFGRSAKLTVGYQF
jgi:outer membrane receptor protein involved in Fe transport